MTKTDSGKGDDWRKDFDFQKYWTNFPVLSGNESTAAKEIKRKGGKVTYVFK